MTEAGPVTVMVHMRHLRALGHCNREPRIFVKAQGWSWTEFITIGIPAERLEATGDPLAIRVAAYARKEAGE